MACHVIVHKNILKIIGGSLVGGMVGTLSFVEVNSITLQNFIPYIQILYSIQILKSHLGDILK